MYSFSSGHGGYSAQFWRPALLRFSHAHPSPFLKKKNTFSPVNAGWREESLGIISSMIPSLITEKFFEYCDDCSPRPSCGFRKYRSSGIRRDRQSVPGSFALFTGIAQGIQPILSSSFGAGRKREMRSILRYALLSMLVLSGLIYGGFFGASQSAAIFNSAG